MHHDDPATGIETAIRSEIARDLTTMADHYEARYPEWADVRRDAYMLRQAARVAEFGWKPVRHPRRPDPDPAYLSEIDRLRASVADLMDRLDQAEAFVRAARETAEDSRREGHDLYLADFVAEFEQVRPVAERPAHGRLAAIGLEAVQLTDQWTTERRTALEDMGLPAGREPEDASTLDDAKREFERDAWDLIERLSGPLLKSFGG
ncbi:hypothetical protein F7Q99_36215 [Streptomyces kaniharaensis]|uniref:Uncharacterized protein n=1 Tax=Streptomyces kaniharaensis TaxID=212423 RepID=A0A6N7L4E6_9ACTN|nr:hypothetical protein [Streptomyces kaniharaensis]MQS17488.1 hypothetical protein [Streptomyces kaniharaensis]